MASKRKRPSGKWEFFVKNKKMLGDRTWSFTFDSESEGDAYCAALETTLRAGLLPQEMRPISAESKIEYLHQAIRHYELNSNVKASDLQQLKKVQLDLGATRLRDIDYNWLKSWVTDMKRKENLAPSTIRHYVGAVSRCFDHCAREGVPNMVVNPCKVLPKGYANYFRSDEVYLETLGKSTKHDKQRDRRLDIQEELNIRDVIAGKVLGEKQRALLLKYQDAIECVFDMALETSMRLSEIYTLSLAQIDLENASIFLKHTKNGDARMVPLSSVAVSVLTQYQERVQNGSKSMKGWSFDGGRLFPWWDGSTDHKGAPTKTSLEKTTRLLSQQFARIFDAAGCPDFHFHDLRHEAISRLYEKTNLTDIQIARISGHKDPRMLLRYTKLRRANIKLW
jgi:integrase